MALIYREDNALTHLQHASHDDLATLVDYLLAQPEGGWLSRIELQNDPVFKEAGGNYQRAWKSIAAQLQLLGGNTLANFMRKPSWKLEPQGVPYTEILRDVCKQLGVQTDKADGFFELESKILAFVTTQNWGLLPTEVRQELARSGKLGSVDTLPSVQQLSHSMAQISTFTQKLLRSLSGMFAAPRLQNGALDHAALGETSKIVMQATPVGLALMAWRKIRPKLEVTLPCVILIAHMRQKQLETDLF
jgi:uncharacterized protein YaaW (UPF0174 family)